MILLQNRARVWRGDAISADISFHWNEHAGLFTQTTTSDCNMCFFHKMQFQEKLWPSEKSSFLSEFNKFSARPLSSSSLSEFSSAAANTLLLRLACLASSFMPSLAVEAICCKLPGREEQKASKARFCPQDQGSDKCPRQRHPCQSVPLGLPSSAQS